MVAGVNGLIGIHALWLVAEAVRHTDDTAIALHHQIMAKIVTEMTLKHKIATNNPVFLVINNFLRFELGKHDT